MLQRLEFAMDVVAADLVERTIEGVIVPYGEVGSIGGVRYRFRPGSIKPARARTPLLVDHDRGRPIGVLAELHETPAGAVARFRVDPTPHGDEALLQAASGSRGALSVGAEVVDYEGDVGGIVDVVEGRLHEVSLLALGAFESATVLRVAAELAEPPEPGEDERIERLPDPDQTELPVEPEQPAAPPPDPEEGTMTEASAAAPVIMAVADRSPRELNAGELVGLMIRAQHGEAEARRYLEAALTESISTDVTGLLPPQYERTVIGAKPTPRPLYNAFRSRPLPGVGLAVNKPKWTTRPDGAWAANVDADATSTKVVIGSQAANVERWDWAGAIPWVVVQRSDPSIIDEIYGEAVQDFYLDVETKIAAKLAAATTDTSTTLGGAIAAFFTANKKTPEAILVAPDVWGKMADKKLIDSPGAAGSVALQEQGLTSSFAGIPIAASASLAATFAYFVTRRAVDARITEPVRLTANAIGALNVELAVVGEGLFDTDYPGEILEMVPTI